MDIHQEKELAYTSDSKLLGKMLAFAKPYWKKFLFSIILAGLVVLAALAQPLIIQVAIDDHINGLYKPMLQVDSQAMEEAEPWLRKQGVSLSSKLQQDGHIYLRVDSQKAAEWATQTELPEGVSKTQIFLLEDERYRIADWIPQADDSLRLVSGGGEQGNPQLSYDGRLYPAETVSDAQATQLREHDFQGFLLLGGIFLVIVVGAAVLNYYQMNLLQNTGQTIIYDIRQKMFAHLSKLHVGYFDKNPVGRIVTRVSHDVEALNQLYSQVIVNLVKEVCLIVGIVAVMLMLNVKLTLITFTVLPILALVTIYYRVVVRKAQRHVRLVLSKLNSFLAENLSGIKIIQIFTREEKQLKAFDKMNEEYYQAGMRTTILGSIFNPAIGFLGTLALAVLIWYGGKSVLGATVNFGVLYAFTLYVQQFYKPLMGLADRYTQIQTSMASAERIFELLEEQPAIVSRADARRLPKRIGGAIEFDRVWFAYDDHNWVLKDISFRIEPGETVAFVGATGAGKSSIINLITRFYDIQKGALRIDGIDVRDMDLEDLRKHVAMIQQDAFVFTGDVDFNIRLNDKQVSEQEVKQTAKRFEMDDFIQQLPEQYHTALGEQGTNLSSGQEQLLSFLRAAVFKPDILILDEATAHIDTETELRVQKALQEISKDRTTLIVAHRLSTIQHADKIVVMHKGEIQEIGNHYQLLKKRGFYHRLYEVQNRDEEKSLSHPG